jgi:ureidoglycolate hydrolase
MGGAVSVKVEPLAGEAFTPYGSVISLTNPVFPEVDEGRPMVMMSRLKRGDDNFRIEQMAIHFSYSQTYIPLRGTLVLIVAPPPPDRDAGLENFHLDYDRVAAFRMEPGDACLIARGTWHLIVPLEDECLFICGTRRGSNAIYPDGELTAGRRTDTDYNDGKEYAPFIEIVDFAKRDGRVIELLV